MKTYLRLTCFGGLDGWGVSTREGTNAHTGLQTESKMDAKLHDGCCCRSVMRKTERAHEARKGNCCTCKSAQ